MTKDAVITLQEWSFDVLVASSACQSSNYLIVGAYLTGQQVALEGYLANNYRALPLSVKCTGK